MDTELSKDKAILVRRAGAEAGVEPRVRSALGRGLDSIIRPGDTPQDGRPEVDVKVLSAAELPEDISFDYNARMPSRASRAYKSMRETLRSNPARFLELNGGISIAHGRFVLDGGHTVLAIQDAIREDEVDPKLIHLVVRDYGALSAGEMERRSAALNRRVTPPLVGERDLEGDWQPIKEALAPEYHPYFEFRPNTKPSAPYGVDFLVSLLHAWNEPRGEKAYSTKGKLVRHYSSEKYARVLPHLNKAVTFWSRLYTTLAAEPRIMKLDCCRSKEGTEVILPTGEKVASYIPEALLWPTFAAFSVLLDGVGNWAAEPEVELSRKKQKLVRQLLADYKASGNNPGTYGKTPGNYLNAIVALRSA